MDPGATLGADVEIGPYAVIGAGVVVGDRCRIGPHACLLGPLTLGAECEVGFAAALGHDPQVKGKRGPWGSVRIGSRSVFREFTSVHRSTNPAGETVVGDDCFLMATAHVAHDCTLGDHVILCNCVMLAGHVEVGSRAFMGGGAGIHQFGRIGELAMVGGNASLSRDAPPFCMVSGDRPSHTEGLNVVGLRRAGLPAATRAALGEAHRILFRSDAPVAERLAAVDRSVPEVDRLVAFVLSSRRGVVGIAGRGDE